MSIGITNSECKQFEVSIRPCIDAVYSKVFGPWVGVERLSGDGKSAHVLDQYFGIDALLHFPTGQTISVQEKCRRGTVLGARSLRVDPRWPDFTQGFRIGVNTEHEREGEWFHLGAQLYFYGWANPDESGLSAWVMLDILRYKLIVESHGGLEGIGQSNQNAVHSKTSFYAIPLGRIWDAVIECDGAEHLGPLPPRPVVIDPVLSDNPFAEE